MGESVRPDRSAAEQAAANTDRELWREGGGDGNGMSYYEPSIHATANGRIGIDVGGTVYTLTLRQWHALAASAVSEPRYASTTDCDGESCNRGQCKCPAVSEPEPTGAQSTQTVDVRGFRPAESVHELKCWPFSFDAILDGVKTFEVRRNDRGFRSGHTLVLREYVPEKDAYTGRVIERQVPYILHGGDWGIEAGYCVLALAVSEGPAEASVADSANTAALDGWVEFVCAHSHRWRTEGKSKHCPVCGTSTFKEATDA